MHLCPFCSVVLHNKFFVLATLVVDDQFAKILSANTALHHKYMYIAIYFVFQVVKMCSNKSVY